MVIFDIFIFFAYLRTMNNKHAQVPNQLFSDTLEFGDKLVYAHIRKYVNKDTLQCYPRLDTIANDCQLSIKTVKAAINRLERSGLITVYKRKGTSSIYQFHRLEDGFERFSEEFLDNKNISPKAKAYYIELQQHLYLNEDERTNDTTYSNSEIAKLLGLSVNTVKKYNTELIQNDILHETQLMIKSDDGFSVTKKSFDLDKLGQAVLYKLKEHEEKLGKHDQEIEDLKQQIEQLKREQLATRKLLGLQNNTYLEDFSVQM